MIEKSSVRGNADVFTLRNSKGSFLAVSAYGGRMTKLSVPDRNGAFDDVLVGYDTSAQYRGENPYFGALIGRFANRIAGGRFELGGEEYLLDCNDGDKCLHGGYAGWDRRLWSAKTEGNSLLLSLFSPHLDQGFPGNMKVEVRYSLTDADEVVIEYSAVSDRDTVCNLTNHSYFNLAGKLSETVLGHELEIPARAVSDFADNRGSLFPILNTPLDFSKKKPVGADIDKPEPHLTAARGYDFNYVLDKGNAFGTAAKVYEPLSGRTLEVLADCPGIQLYTSNFIDNPILGKRVYGRRCGMCLETQGFPYAPNCPDFPSALLPAGGTYRRKTVYRFGVK